MSMTTNTAKTELVISDSAVDRHRSRVASLANNVIPGLCKDKILQHIKSIHLNNTGDVINLNMCLRTLGDSRYHWITESYSDAASLRDMLQIAIGLHKHHAPSDGPMMDDWSAQLDNWKAKPGSPLSLYRAD